MSDASQPFDPIISDLAGDADLADIVEEFVGELPDRIAALTHALDDHNFDDLRRIAHQLKGAAGGYGFSVITDAAGQLEKSAHCQDTSVDLDATKVREELDALVDLCRRARAT